MMCKLNATHDATPRHSLRTYTPQRNTVMARTKQTKLQKAAQPAKKQKLSAVEVAMMAGASGSGSGSGGTVLLLTGQKSGQESNYSARPLV